MTDIEDIANRTAAGIALAYRPGEAWPVEITECLLERIANAKVDRARAEAHKAEARYAAGMPSSALDGVPIAWKDIFDVAGTPTTATSKLLAGGPVKAAVMPCVASIKAAGMVTVGKLNMTEFAFSGLGLNPHFGTPLNPNDPNTPRSRLLLRVGRARRGSVLAECVSGTRQGCRPHRDLQVLAAARGRT